MSDDNKRKSKRPAQHSDSLIGKCVYCGEEMKKSVKVQLYHPNCRKVKRSIDSMERARKIALVIVNKTKICACGKTFTKTSNTQIYCSIACRTLLSNNFSPRNTKPKEDKEENNKNWPVPKPPDLPKYNRILRHIFFEARNHSG